MVVGVVKVRPGRTAEEAAMVATRSDARVMGGKAAIAEARALTVVLVVPVVTRLGEPAMVAKGVMDETPEGSDAGPGAEHLCSVVAVRR